MHIESSKPEKFDVKAKFSEKVYHNLLVKN